MFVFRMIPGLRFEGDGSARVHNDVWVSRMTCVCLFVYLFMIQDGCWFRMTSCWSASLERQLGFQNDVYTFTVATSSDCSTSNEFGTTFRMTLTPPSRLGLWESIASRV